MFEITNAADVMGGIIIIAIIAVAIVSFVPKFRDALLFQYVKFQNDAVIAMEELATTQKAGAEKRATFAEMIAQAEKKANAIQKEKKNGKK